MLSSLLVLGLLSDRLLQRGFPTKILYALLVSAIIVIYSTHHSFLHFTILTILGEKGGKIQILGDDTNKSE
jgi:sugar phosphate permease